MEATSSNGRLRAPRPSLHNHAMEIMANLPSRQSVIGDVGSFERVGSSQRTRTPSAWITLSAANKGGHTVLSRQSSLMPDLEQQVNTSDSLKDDLWERRKTIRSMPASLEMKRQMKSQLMKQQSSSLRGYDVIKFRQNFIWRRRRERVNNFLKRFRIWEGSFKTIDGQFGMGVGSYFRFLKWLFCLNIYISLIVITAVMIPQLVLRPYSFSEAVTDIRNLTTTPDHLQSAQPIVDQNSSEPIIGLTIEQKNFVQEAINCSEAYNAINYNIMNNASTTDQFLNVLQGKGYLEMTILFYGFYYNKTYYDEHGQTATVYVMPLAYILVTGAYFILSLFLMVRNSAKGFKESFVDSQSRFFQHSSKIFTAWDFCMYSETACRQKHDILFREFKLDMENERTRQKRLQRSKTERCVLYTFRFVINVIVVVVLIAAGVAIYYANEYSLKWSDWKTNEFTLLLVEYIPSVCITILNATVPLAFIYIVMLEDYSPEFEIKITLVRTVFLRLSSLAVLIASLYGQITQCQKTDYKCGNCGRIECWETYVGQQFYKLAILDFVINIAVVLLYEFPRRLCVERFQNRLFRFVGLPDFDIPRSVLDIVYGQTLCWIGAFFCPFIPIITVIKFFIIFYLKKESLLRNFVSSARTHASKSNAFFTIVLLVSFVLTTIPVGYSIGKIPPSQSCGPFRIYSSESHFMFSTIGNLISSWPSQIGNIFYWLGSISFIIPLIIVMCIAMYYYYIVASGHRRMIEVLKDQLALEGRDKRFLIERVNEVMTSIYGAAGK